MNHLKHAKQKGDALLEALISVVLMAVIVLGIAIVTTQTTKNLADTKTTIFVVNQLKEKLSSLSRDELCAIDDSNNYLTMPNGATKNVSTFNCDAKLQIDFTITKDDIEIFTSNMPTEIDAPIVYKTVVEDLNNNELAYSVGGKIITIN